MIIEMASATLVWVVLAALYLWLRRKPKKFEVGQVVQLVPRKRGWDREVPHYSEGMVDLQKGGAVFEVVYKDHQGVLTLMPIYCDKGYVYVWPSWITPAKCILKNI